MSKCNANIFLIQTTSEPTKIGLNFSNKVLRKLKFSKNANDEKYGPKMIFFKEIFFRNIQIILDIELEFNY